ncbi:hypothetical protein HISP_14355 [Haloarcula hispanica N601]|uniref:Toxin n=2 Tax=Haloarcula hispanica TaxID=51589 RepID=W0GHU4_HALHI|nr:hypothetical protein [Haloarcula hispanica]AEM58404.1 conserved hypothetical protein [Haloarcula hispanica ATCC 33960]AHF55869.1 hypothetical protein HISP_14355 [Haloarcula hispanica N601]QRG24219.1 RelE/ParE toxin domain family protein [Haloarcula virus Harhisp1]
MGQTASDDEWDWEFSPRAENQFSQLDSDIQQRIIDKLDEVVSSEWGKLDDFLEPLMNPLPWKFRVGDTDMGAVSPRAEDARKKVLNRPISINK